MVAFLCSPWPTNMYRSSSKYAVACLMLILRVVCKYDFYTPKQVAYGVLGIRFGSLELKIGSLESDKIIIGSCCNLSGGVALIV